MKQTIRANVFETNSSSNHSVVITNTAALPNLEDFHLDIHLSYQNYEEFEHQSSPRPLTDPEEKLAYLYRYAIGYYRNFDLRARRGVPEEECDYEEPEWFKRGDVQLLAERQMERFHQLFPNCKFHIDFDGWGDPEVSINHQSMESWVMSQIVADVELIRWYMSDACTVYLTGDWCGVTGVLFGDGYSDKDSNYPGCVANVYMAGDTGRCIGGPVSVKDCPDDDIDSDVSWAYRKAAGIPNRW